MAIRVLLVDDSAIIRGLLTKALTSDPDISIAGSAYDGVAAIQMAKSSQPDIIVLDIEMPNMDGITALPELLKVSPSSKIIMASTLTERNAAISLKALSLGASDYVAKPSTRGNELEIFYTELRSKIHALAPKRTYHPSLSVAPVAAAPKPATGATPYPVLPSRTPLNSSGIAALAIASSTGGPQALTQIFTEFQGKLKSIPIFVTQHMPATFTKLLAEQLGKVSGKESHEAKNGELVLPGYAYIAPGDYHMLAEKGTDGRVTITTNQKPPENFCRPAADPMLRSLSQIYGSRLAVVVLTGMGHDGMEGAKAVVKNGGSVIAQDEASCVVYGMPKAVVDQNLCKAVLPLSQIGAFLIRQIDGTPI